jgi:hypothetical protein
LKNCQKLLDRLMAKLILQCNMAGLSTDLERDIIQVHVLKMQAIELATLVRQNSLCIEEKEALLSLGETFISQLRSDSALEGRL